MTKTIRARNANGIYEYIEAIDDANDRLSVMCRK